MMSNDDAGPQDPQGTARRRRAAFRAVAGATQVEFANPAGKPRFLVVAVAPQDVLKLRPRGHVARTVA
jgi:hypothetical protein